MSAVTLFAAIAPYVVLLGVVVIPAFAVVVAWAVLWLVQRSRFVSWQFALWAGSAAVVLLLVGILVLFLWPVTPEVPSQNGLFSADVGIKLFGGVAAILGGAAALLAALLSWGVGELVRSMRSQTRQA